MAKPDEKLALAQLEMVRQGEIIRQQAGARQALDGADESIRLHFMAGLMVGLSDALQVVMDRTAQLLTP